MAADAAELMHAGCCLSHLRFISERDNLCFLVCCQVDSGNLLPEDEYNPNCQLESKNKCLRSGDERVNDNAGLASIHTVLVREHNRLASLLETVNPHWDEETLYQEARKMVGAEIQHITYNEFLPAILGEVLTETFQLKSKGNGYHMDYNDELPTTTLNSVGNAVLQFIPSLLPGMLEFYSPNGDKRWELAINSTYWAPSTAHDTRTVQELVMGLINAKAQKVDLNMAPGTKHCKLIQGNRNVFVFLYHQDTSYLNGFYGKEVGIQYSSFILISKTLSSPKRIIIKLFPSLSGQILYLFLYTVWPVPRLCGKTWSHCYSKLRKIEREEVIGLITPLCPNLTSPAKHLTWSISYKVFTLKFFETLYSLLDKKLVIRSSMHA